MRKKTLIGTSALAGLSALTAAALLLFLHAGAARAQEAGAVAVTDAASEADRSKPLPPLPPVPIPPNVLPLTTLEQLGKRILYDTTLSDPPGYACAQCHAPAVGFTSGLSSRTNRLAGPQPGVVPGRSGPRAPQSYAYATFSPVGPIFNQKFAGAWVGGAFWDGRVPDLAAQARQPFLSPLEMANRPTNGIVPPHAGGYSSLVVHKVRQQPYAKLFKEIYGPNVFNDRTIPQIYTLITRAIAAFESSGEISQFSSKYDATKYAVPPQNLYKLTATEERGRTLFFGKATCSGCHSSANFPLVTSKTNGKDTFTLYLFQNVGVPRNEANPFYKELEFNPAGKSFVDYGLGANPNPSPNGKRFYLKTPGDRPEFRGLFQAPTLRNVDLRPHPAFVKAYMHNGVFKSLEEVVNFYNRRNIAVRPDGRPVAFDLRDGPPAGAERLLPPPEVMNNVVNIKGERGEIGNLGLDDREVRDIVAFLQTLSDGFTTPNPVK
jgi:cytochrome c peroxidase